MKPEYEEEIIETLESTFGAIEDKSSLASAIMCAARNATEDNIPDYVGDLLYTIDNSFLEDLNEDMIASLYRKTVTNSVAYMMMERLGIDTEEHFFREDFEDIVNFNTPETLNALGFATSDIAEMGLAEIAKTVMSLDKQNRIIVENQNSDYNIVKENQTERSLENDRTDLHDAGRLQTAQSDLTGAAGSTDGKIRSTESEVPEGKPKSSVLQSPDELQVERASDGSGTDGDRADGTLDERASGERVRDGEPESNRYDELGSTDEQHSQSGSGNGVEASSLRLDYYDRSNEDKSLPFFGGDDTVREILGTTPHLKASKDEIRAFFENVADDEKRTDKRTLPGEDGFQNGKADEAAVGKDHSKQTDLTLCLVPIKRRGQKGKCGHQRVDQKADQRKKQPRFEGFHAEILADERGNDHQWLSQLDDQRGESLGRCVVDHTQTAAKISGAKKQKNNGNNRQ
jgi:hypothetical protein